MKLLHTGSAWPSALICWLLYLIFIPTLSNAQTLHGRVTDNRAEQNIPLIGATVIWQGTTQGTTTNPDGTFSLVRMDSTQTKIVVSYIGYATDTILVKGQNHIHVNLQRTAALGEVKVTAKTPSFSAITPAHSQVITARDLTKSACCNLAESFETNASVEVSTSDAVSGAKQIQMLGLDGSYSLMTVDNIPSLRGLATPYRLNYISGTWIDAIDIIKGTGSVINGYESISGQVNVRLKEPEKAERLYFNLYGNTLAKFDANLNVATPINKKISTVFLLHADHIGNRVDGNQDGFLDLPLSTQYNVFNKWKYKSGNVVSEIGLGALQENRLGGQTNYQKGDYFGSAYGTEMKAQRANIYSKSSYTFPGKPYQSIGLILANTRYNFDSRYGRRPYDGEQNTTEAKLLFQSAINNTTHTYKTGLSYLLDDFKENFADTAFNRREVVPGVFAEYVYQGQKMTLVAGARLDQHNLFGTIFTPRFNLKYDLDPTTIFRVAAGKGFRVANPIAENTAALVSSRAFRFAESLNPEKAWNMGGSFTKYFTLGQRNGTFVADYYYTTFSNQVIADMYSSPEAVIFSNLAGRSFSKSFQAELQYEVLKGLDLKAAYKYFDVKSTYAGNLLAKPYNPQHRFFVNAGFATPFDKWRLDLTTQWFGLRPVPVLEHMAHSGAARTAFSDRYYLLNGQVTRAFKRWEIYVGGENLLNYRQPNPIVGAANPFGEEFDASMVWGPTIGRVIYSGLRFKIN